MKLNLSKVVVFVTSVILLGACGKNKTAAINKAPNSAKPTTKTAIEFSELEADFLAPSKAAVEMAKVGVIVNVNEDHTINVDEPVVVQAQSSQQDVAKKRIGDMQAALAKVVKNYSDPFYFEANGATFQKKLSDEQKAVIKMLDDAVAAALTKLENESGGAGAEEPVEEELNAIRTAVAEAISVDGLVEVKSDENEEGLVEGQGAAAISETFKRKPGGSPPVVGGG